MTELTLPSGKAIKLYTPTEMKAHLDKYIIGQEKAKRAICTAVYNHYKRLYLNTQSSLTTKVDKSNKDIIDIYPKEDITILGKKSDVSLNYDIELKLNNMELPLKKNSVIGRIIVKNQNKVVREVDAIVKEDIEKINFLQLFLNTIKDIATGDLL